MIQIAIADDDAVFLAKIEKYVRKYQEENNTDIQLTTFSDAKELIEGYHPVYDIVILDIEMPGMNGMEAAEKIRQTDENVVLMFITNMIQYAIRGYSVGALDFVMKPVNESNRADSEKRKRNFAQTAGFGKKSSGGCNLLCGDSEPDVVLSYQ